MCVCACLPMSRSIGSSKTLLVVDERLGDFGLYLDPSVLLPPHFIAAPSAIPSDFKWLSRVENLTRPQNCVAHLISGAP